jgi:murein DD-endopeptidase MepM/ murein hydrolase activator NlpD
LKKQRPPEQGFTVLIVPDSGQAPIRSIRLRPTMVRRALLVVLLFLGGFVSATLLWPSGLVRGIGLVSLAKENALLKQRVLALDDDLDRLRQRLGESAFLEERLRVLADLPPIDDGVRQMGVGGPDFAVNDPLAQVDPEGAAVTKQAARNVDELLRRAELQRYSFLEIASSLEARREHWSRIPSISPVREGSLTSGFGMRLDPFTEVDAFHRGLDLSAERGAPILATASGRVVFAGTNAGYGRTVRIDHGSGIETTYAHLLEIKVKPGQRVKRGDTIARVGTSGRTTAPHVHYEVVVNGRAVDPESYILPVGEVVD